ncbi:hypothetical protein PWT90_00502 [Aphanocladium album]|nr:hypothetical protein PWT90_00502 [Aphanocladium album]
MPTDPNRPVRFACVRCHSHKVRCPGKAPGENRCGRCIKSSSLCVFGPSVQGMRPAAVSAAGLRTASEMDQPCPASAPKRACRSQATTPQPYSETPPTPSGPALLLEDVDWSLALAGDNGAMAVATMQDISTDGLFDVATPLPEAEKHVDVVSLLTKLNTDALRHVNSIPLPAVQVQTNDASHINRINKFDIDETLNLTQQFISTVTRLDLQYNFNFLHPGTVEIDRATVSLVVSCWQRYIAMYDYLFQGIMICAENISASPPANARAGLIVLPPVHIGSFQADPRMSILLQMVAVLDHSTQLVRAMNEFVSRIEATNQSSSSVSSPESPVGEPCTRRVATTGARDAVFHEIRMEAANMLEQNRRVKNQLKAFDLL